MGLWTSHVSSKQSNLKFIVEYLRVGSSLSEKIAAQHVIMTGMDVHVRRIQRYIRLNAHEMVMSHGLFIAT